MPYDKEYVIRLSGLDLGQVIDGLDARLTAWRRTAKSLLEESSEDDDFLIEECDGPEEAAKIADHYDRLIQLIVAQQRDQDEGG